MISRRTKVLVALTLVWFMLAVIVSIASANNEPPESGEKITICHKARDGKERTKEIPIERLQKHLSHGDYVGECKPTVTPTTPSPTATPTMSPPTATPTMPPPTATPTTPPPTATPTMSPPTATPMPETFGTQLFADCDTYFFAVTPDTDFTQYTGYMRTHIEADWQVVSISGGDSSIHVWQTGQTYAEFYVVRNSDGETVANERINRPPQCNEPPPPTLPPPPTTPTPPSPTPPVSKVSYVCTRFIRFRSTGIKFAL